MKKYYFISFMYGASEKIVENRVIDESPFDWQKRVNKTYPGQYILMNWIETNKEVYNNYIREEENTNE